MSITYPVYTGSTVTGHTTEYAGAVLTTREENYYDDSDFYAVVWDEASQQVKRVDYGSTRYAGGGYAHEDATPEVIAKAEAWLREWRIRTTLRLAALTAADVAEGKRVQVVAGRKVAHGTVGTVVRLWQRESRYGTWTTAKRALVRQDDGAEFWTDQKNLAVVDPQQYIPAEADVRAECARQRSIPYHAPFSHLAAF